MKKVLGVYSSPTPHWVGDGFPVKTLFSYQMQDQQISPFLLLDYAGPIDFPPSEHKRGVGEHPHRGFETVTLVYQGELAHQDSTGKGGVIGPGDVQWMTAGSGIMHEEFHSEAFTQSGGTLEMLQLWVNLPQKHKMATPKYQAIAAEDIPSIPLPNKQGMVRLIAGEYGNLVGPAETYTPMQVLNIAIKPAGKQQLSVPEGWTTILIVRKGQARINGQLISCGQTMILSRSGQLLEIESELDSDLVLLSGEPIQETVVGYGPFVMNSKAEIQQAFSDLREGKFDQLSH
ncbi:MAG: pirin family protein [Pseudomonadales bacterium]